MYRVHFWTRFKDFDPLSQAVSGNSLKQLPDIVARARALVQGRTREQLIHVVETIFWMLDEYFQKQKDVVIKQILDTGGWELGYLGCEFRNEEGLNDLLDNWPEDCDDKPRHYPKHENTSELVALIECLGNFVISDDTDFPNGKEHEYFAVLALWKISDCIACLNLKPETRALYEAMDRLTAQLSPKNSPIFFGSAQQDSVEELFEALEAVCWAERVKATEALTANVLSLRTELAQLRSKTDEQAASIAKGQVSLAASKAAIKRHSENHAMKADVFAWCEAHLNTYPSMDKAAEAIAGKGKLVPVAVRTVRQWIGEWSKRHRSARTL